MIVLRRYGGMPAEELGQSAVDLVLAHIIFNCQTAVIGAEMIAMQLYQLITEESPDFSTKPFREWASRVEVDSLFSLRKNSLISVSVMPS